MSQPGPGPSAPKGFRRIVVACLCPETWSPSLRFNPEIAASGALEVADDFPLTTVKCSYCKAIAVITPAGLRGSPDTPIVARRIQL